MYLAMSIEEVRKPSTSYNQSVTPGLRVMLWRVELNTTGRPVWVTHRQGSTWWIYSGFGYQGNEANRARKAARASQPKAIPTIASAAHNKLVTMSEAAKLVDVVQPGSLDRLTEMLQDVHDPYALQNYVKPPKVKPPKAEPEPVSPPTAAERAQTRLERARAKVAEWERKATHASGKAKEWQRKAKRLERRARQLIAAGG